MIVCKKCGAELPDEARFCMMCGRAVNYTPTPRKRGNGQGTAVKRGKTWRGISAGYSFTVTDEDGTTRRVRRRKTKDGFATKRTPPPGRPERAVKVRADEKRLG